MKHCKSECDADRRVACAIGASVLLERGTHNAEHVTWNAEREAKEGEKKIVF